MHHLIALGLRCPEYSTLRRLAEGTLRSGDPVGLDMLWDELLMEGLGMFELEVGKSYLISTVTFYYLGRVRSISLTSVVLSEASRVYDTGRFSDALRTGKLVEVEPYPDEVIVAAAQVNDVCLWDHELPRERIPR